MRPSRKFVGRAAAIGVLAACIGIVAVEAIPASAATNDNVVAVPVPTQLTISPGGTGTFTFNPNHGGSIFDGTYLPPQTSRKYPENIDFWIGPNVTITAITGCSNPGASGESNTNVLLPLPQSSVGCFIPGGSWTTPITVTVKVAGDAAAGQRVGRVQLTQADSDGASNGTATGAEFLIVVPGPPINASLAGSPGDGVVGVTKFNYPFTRVAGADCKLTAGSLPPGLTLDGPTCVVSGVPTTVGTYTYTLTTAAADGRGASASVDVKQTITAPTPPQVLPAPVINPVVGGGALAGMAVIGFGLSRRRRQYNG